MKSAHDRATAIRSEIRTVRSNLPGVEDRTPWWATLLQRWGLLLLIVAVLVAAWYFGLGGIIRAGMSWIAALVPDPTTDTEAKLAAEDVRSGQATPRQREAIAARRARDPRFNRQFRRHKERRR